MKKSPLSDLSFFRFPDLTQETVVRIVLLIVLLAVIVVAAILLQRVVFRWNDARSRLRAMEARTEVGRLQPALRDVLEKLVRFSTLADPAKLLHDPVAYEAAVEAMASEAAPEELESLGRLRRTFHLNVMNPEVPLFCTRQLLPDLGVRLFGAAAHGALDLYCALLEVDERYLFFDLSFQEELAQVLAANPEVLLIFWREESGETLFRIRLEPVPGSGEMGMFRSPHAFRAQDIANRAEFRLTVDFPLRFHYMEQHAVRQLRAGRGEAPPPQTGEGVLQDVSYGGAAFLADSALPPGGFAQIQFEAHGKPLKIVLEPVSNTLQDDGRVLVRGRLRGMAPEAKSLLFAFLSREQIRRLREKKGAFVRAKP